MSSEWSSHKIGDLFELVNGYAFKSADFIAAGVPVLKIKNVKPAKVVLDDLSYVSAEIASKRTDKEIKRGDILITMSGNRFDGSKETWVGKVAHFDIPGRYMLNQRVGVLRPRAGVEIDRKCAAYFLSSDDYQKLFISIATSSGGQANLSPAQILGEQLRLPSIDEQIQISEMLGALDDRIALLRETNATLEAIAQALFKSWFVDFDPVRAKQQGRPPESLDPFTPARGAPVGAPGVPPDPSAAAALFPDDFEDTELGPVPKGWRVGKLGDVATTNRRQIQPDAMQEGTLYVGLEHIPRQSLGLDAWATVAGVESAKSCFDCGDILFGKLRPYFHKVVIAPFNGVCSTDILVCNSSSADFYGFVAMHLFSKELIAYADRLSNGAKMPRVSWKDLAEYAIAIPPSELASCFTDIVQPFFARITANVTKAQTLATLRDTLLPRLISGQLRLPEAKSFVEEATA